MSKQRFLGGLLGANPVRAGSFTDASTTTTFDAMDLNDFTSSTAVAETITDYRTLTTPATNGYGYNALDVSGLTGKGYFEWYKDPAFSESGFGIAASTPYTGSSEAYWQSVDTPELDIFGMRLTTGGTLQRRVAGAAQVATGSADAYGDILFLEIDFDTGDYWAGVSNAANTARQYVTSTYTVTGTRPGTPTGNSASINYLWVGHYNASLNYNLNSKAADYILTPETGYGAVYPVVTPSTVNRTTANVGIVSLDEAGPEANGSNELTPFNWGGIRGRDTVVGPAGYSAMSSEGILSLSQSLQALYGLSPYHIKRMEPELALDFIGGEYRTAGATATFADAFTGTSPKLTYSTTSNSTMTQGYGPELVTNGGFDTDSGWTTNVNGSGHSITGGQLVLSSAADLSATTRDIAIVGGGAYSVTVDVASVSSGELRLLAYGSSANEVVITPNISTAGVHVFDLPADDPGSAYLGKVVVQVLAANTSAVINSVSVREAPKIVWAPHNLALNSATPATQTITVTSGVDYTVRVTGTGSMALSGAGTGTATDGSPVTITASTTSLTITLTGSLDTVAVYRSDLGGMAQVPGAATGFEYYVPTSGSAEYLPRVGHHVYNGSTWVNEGLLIESEARTNLVTTSAAISGGNWNASTGGVITENAVTAPDGTQTGSIYDTNGAYRILRNVVSVAAGTTYTWSFYAKNIDATSVAYRVYDETQAADIMSATSYFSQINTSDWTRVSVSFTAPTGCSQAAVYLTSGDNGGTVAFWGAQLEAGSTPSSYMPTNGGTYTRTAQSLEVPAHWYNADNPTPTGPELVTNGDFGTGDLSGWTDASFGTGTAVYNSGGADLTRVDVSNEGQIRQAITTTAGRIYEVSYDRTSGTSGRVWVGTGTSGTDRLNIGEFPTTGASNSFTFVATGSTTYLLFNVGANGVTVRFDNISVRQVSAPQFGWPEPEYIGSELVTNGDFPAGLSDGDVGYDNGDGTVDGWTASTDVELSIVSGAIRVQNSSTYSEGNSGSGVFALTTTAGKVYVVEATVVTANASGTSGIGVSSSNGVGQVTLRELGSHDAVGAGTYTITFTANSSTTYLKLFNWSVNANYYADFDNVSVREINPLSVSIQMDGRVTYADDGASQSQAGKVGTAVFYTHWASSSDYVEGVLSTSGVRTGSFVAQSEEASSGDDRVLSAETTYSPGVNVPFNIASRHGSTFVNGAVDGVALTADTTPTALPDLSGTDLQIAYDFMGTIGTFRQFAGDIGDTGLVTATKPSTEPTLSLTFDGTAGGSFYNLSWSE